MHEYSRMYNLLKDYPYEEQLLFSDAYLAANNLNFDTPFRNIISECLYQGIRFNLLGHLFKFDPNTMTMKTMIQDGCKLVLVDLLHDKLFSNGDASNAIPCGEFPISEDKGKDVCNELTPKMCTSFYIEGISSDNNYNCKLSNSKCVKGEQCQFSQCNPTNDPSQCWDISSKLNCSNYYTIANDKPYNCVWSAGIKARCEPDNNPCQPINNLTSSTPAPSS